MSMTHCVRPIVPRHRANSIGFEYKQFKTYDLFVLLLLFKVKGYRHTFYLIRRFVYTISITFYNYQTIV